jgi:hypothetical protein
MKKLKLVWLRLNERDNTLDYLEKCSYFIQQKGKIKWKWVIITLRQALYNFCILSIAGTDCNNVLVCNKNKKLNKLIDFPEALNKIQSAGIMQITQLQKKDCDLLNATLRNNFEHFIPKGWSIQLNGMPRIVDSALQIIEFLTFKSGRISLTSYKKRKIKRLVNIIRKHSTTLN